MKYKLQWKEEFRNEWWYKDNPAEEYLTDYEKTNIILQYLSSGSQDSDSEVEVIVLPTKEPT